MGTICIYICYPRVQQQLDDFGQPLYNVTNYQSDSMAKELLLRGIFVKLISDLMAFSPISIILMLFYHKSQT